MMGKKRIDNISNEEIRAGAGVANIRGFAKLKKFQKSKNNLDRAQPTRPTPLSKYFFFLETHQWHGQNTQITTFNNVQTECITLCSYHMSTHSPHWK